MIKLPIIPPLSPGFPEARPIPTKDVIDLNHRNLGLLAPGWFLNARDNAPRVERDFARKPSSILDFGARVQGLLARDDLVALVSSGPSLDEVVGDLKDFPGLILAGVTSLGPLLAHGVTPHAVLVVDKNPVLGDRLRLIPESLRRGVALLAPPTVDPSVLREFRWSSRFYFLSHVDGADLVTCPGCHKDIMLSYESPDEYPLNTTMRWLFPEIGVWVLQAGAVGSVMPEIVQRLQGAYEARALPKPDSRFGDPRLVGPSLAPHAKILLYGYDQSFPGGRSRSTTYSWVGPGQASGPWTPVPQPQAPLHLPSSPKVGKDSHGQDVLTDESQLAYKRTLLTWWYLGWFRRDLTPQFIYHIEREVRGIIREIPKARSWREADSASYYSREDVERAYRGFRESSGASDSHSGLDGRDLKPDELDVGFWMKEVRE